MDNDVILGGVGGDMISAGGGDDIVFGDNAEMAILNNLARFAQTTARTVGDGDTLFGNEGEDVLVGGAGGDRIDGDADDDLIFGDNVELDRRGDLFGDITNPRFRVLLGQVIYSRNDIPAFLQGLGALPASQFEVGQVLVDPDNASNYRDPDILVGGDAVPIWIDWEITLLDHDVATELANGNNFGNDYIAGGSGHDQIFGQLGDDTIQGDGGIESLVNDDTAVGGRGPEVLIDLTPTLTGVTAPGALAAPYFTPSEDAASDGDDYIEGNGGSDVIFGNLGQDDIIGGSSSLFSLDQRDERPDGGDLIFGGSGTKIGHDALAANAQGDITVGDEHARDADVIAGDNANIYRLVGTGTVTDPMDATNTVLGQMTDSFLEFSYDALRGPDVQRIIARAVELLDYTPGGPDFKPDKFDPEHPDYLPDIGDGDEVHGESGDDVVYGMVGKDVLFGDSESDDLVGGWGADWISGGQGMDGVIGDDGRILTSRYAALEPINGNGLPVANPDDPNDYAELLNGILKVDLLDKKIRTPGDIQTAIINPSEMVNGQMVGEIFKSVDLTPFNLDPNTAMQDRLFEPLYANDIIFGGRGNDFLHGSAGDDAISGAEALPEFFAAPINPGNALRFDADRIEFADYNEDDPWSRIDPFFLNLAPSGDPNGTLPADEAIDDNFDEDAIFGDLGNDWLVGGPDNHNLFGGFGADLLDADDDKGTNGGLNDAADPINIDIQDRALGGAGRDVLIANTGGDRLMDWIGEFSSFIVPFAPFGEFTITRAVFPNLFEFLYDLSASLGADPTRSADTGNLAERNGEPDGELGLVTQKDGGLWQDQTGAPIDPQPGNIPGGERLTLRGVDFNGGTAEGFAVDSGQWQVTQGRLEVSPTLLGEDAVSVFHVGEYLPGYFEMTATINAGKPTAGFKSNAYMIFDYHSPTDFKFAGVNISTDKLQIGHRDALGWHVDVQTPARLKPNTDYNMLLALNGVTATLLIDGTMVFSHAFAPRTDPDGFTYGLNAGFVGIGAENSIARIDNVVVQKLKPEVTFEHGDDFIDGVAERLGAPSLGAWQVTGARLVGSPSAGADIALTTYDLDVGPNSWLELEATLSADSLGGVFFDYYGVQDYKFAGVLSDTNQVVIGHWSKNGTITYDALADIPFAVGTDFDLRVSLKGTTVSVAVNGHDLLGHVFNAVVVDGALGLMAKDGAASFDSATVRTDDPAFLPEATTTLRAATTAQGFAGVPAALSEAELQPILEAAVRRFGAEAVMDGFDVRVADLPGLTLGQTLDNAILIDIDAAGHSWFVDPSPDEDSEFRKRVDDDARQATNGSAAEGRIDLLTVVMHELGHVMGVDHVEDAEPDLMSASLETGLRLLPPVAVKGAKTASTAASEKLRGNSQRDDLLTRIFYEDLDALVDLREARLLERVATSLAVEDFAEEDEQDDEEVLLDLALEEKFLEAEEDEIVADEEQAEVASELEAGDEAWGLGSGLNSGLLVDWGAKFSGFLSNR
jgi:Ca2+-binding RTX toxin-like protein